MRQTKTNKNLLFADITSDWAWTSGPAGSVWFKIEIQNSVSYPICQCSKLFLRGIVACIKYYGIECK